MSNILSEYLVALQFSADEPSFNKLKSMMETAEKVVTDHAGGMARKVLEAQAAIVGAFTSVSAAIIGVVDKAAMADQGYRLLGLRMLMTTDSARKLDIITKALGADIGEIRWDPELRERAGEISEEIDKVFGGRGSDRLANAEKQMKAIRDLRFQFTLLDVGLKGLAFNFASDLAKKMGIGDLTTKIHEFVEWFTGKIPELSDKLSNYAIPALEGTWRILKAAGEAGKEFGVLFTNMIGLLSGDTSILGATFNFDKLAKAIGHVGETLEWLFNKTTLVEEALAHFASGISLFLARDFTEASKEFKAGLSAAEDALLGESKAAKQLKLNEQMAREPVQTLIEHLPFETKSKYGGGLLTSIGGVLPEDVKPQDLSVAERLKRMGQIKLEPAPDREPEPVYGSRFLGLLADDWAGVKELIRSTTHDWFLDSKTKKENGDLPLDVSRLVPLEPSSVESPSRAARPTSGVLSKTEVMAAITEAAQNPKYNVPVSLALAVADQESGFNQSKVSGKGAVGVMQLEKGTASDLGVDRTDVLQNIEGGVHYLSQLIDRYHGNVEKALSAYNAGMGRVDKSTSMADLPEETRNYVPSVITLSRKYAAKIPEVSSQDQAAITSVIPTGSDGAAMPKWMAPQDNSKASFDENNFAALMQYRQAPSEAAPRVMNNNTSVSLGGINVYVTNPGASAQDIAQATREEVRQYMKDNVQQDLVQLSPTW